MMNEGRKFTKTHEWVEQIEDGLFLIGLSTFAVKELGSIVYVNLPSVGDQLRAGESFGDVESVKAVSEIICPCDCTVRRIHEEVLDAPELLNENPLNTWLIEVDHVDAWEELLNETEYEEWTKKGEA